MIIRYFDKKKSKIESDSIKAQVFKYEISEEDMNKISELQYCSEPLVVGLCKDSDSKIVELLVDSIDNGRILIGAKESNKFILTQFIVAKGLEALLNALSTHMSF